MPRAWIVPEISGDVHQATVYLKTGLRMFDLGLDFLLHHPHHILHVAGSFLTDELQK